MKHKFSINRLAIAFASLLLAAGVSSCGENAKKTNYDYGNEDPVVWTSMQYKIEQKKIDSCEYLIIFGVKGRNIIHKANCDNPIHACR